MYRPLYLTAHFLPARQLGASSVAPSRFACARKSILLQPHFFGRACSLATGLRPWGVGSAVGEPPRPYEANYSAKPASFCFLRVRVRADARVRLKFGQTRRKRPRAP